MAKPPILGNGSRAISRLECSRKMQLRTALVSRKYEDIAEQAGAGTPTFNYFAPMSGRQQRNAYIFTTESLLQILFGSSDFSAFFTQKGLDFINPNINHSCPTNILAILGAHVTDNDDEGFSKGQSTVILVPANASKDNSSEYHTIPLPEISNETKKLKPNAIGSETIGVEFPPSAVIEDPPTATTSNPTVTAAMKAKKNMTHTFKIV